MKRKLALVAGIVVLLLVLPMCFVSEGYSGLCIRCLQPMSGVDKSFLGILYYHDQRLTHENGGLMSPSNSGQNLPGVNPKTYEEIFGKSCEHNFVRTGFCRYGAGGVGCGVYGGSRDYELRLSLERNLYLTFRRIPNRQLAQQTYALIEQFYPEAKKGERIERPMQSVFEADAKPNEPMSILIRGLALVHDEKEWQAVIDAAQAGNGAIDILNNRDNLISRLKDPDPVVRRQAVNSLAARKEPESWQAIATILDNPEDVVGKEAATQILCNKYFDLYDRILAWETPAGYTAEPGGITRYLELNDFLPELTNEDIRTLLSQKKPRVDRLCFRAIDITDRFQFLDEILAVLNERPSEPGERTIRHLIAGPYPDLGRDEKTQEPLTNRWQNLQEASKGLLNARNVRNGHRTDRLIHQALELGSSKQPGTWEAWQEIYERWIKESASERWSAAFAEAMYAVDPSKTVQYLSERLDSADDRWGNHASNVLAGMAEIGIPEFLPAIEKFIAKSRGSNYDKHPAYKVYVDYAQHRCRQINHWKLVTDTNGVYEILRNTE